MSGDEMNIHLAQSIQARNELARITNVKYQIVGAKNSSPIIGCVQDSVSGAFLLTSKGTELSGKECSNLLCNTSVKDKSKIKKNKTYNGSELFSFLIPDGINSSKGDFFKIKDGKLIKGLLDKSQLASKKNSIIHYVWDSYGADTTQKFIDNSQRLILNFLLSNGLSIGFGDCIIKNDVISKVKDYVDNKILETKYQLTQYENEQDKIDPEIVESSIQSELGAIGSNVGKIVTDSLDLSNNFYVLVKSGAKGNPTNIQKGFGCIGQLSVEGTRIKKKVNGRSIVHFHKDDDTPDARGFINRNYLDGLEGHHYFFDAMAGREGLIDTAIKTATTGYIQRKLIKALEDLMVRYDGTVRASNNMVIQYIYGENGINQLTQTEIKLKLIDYSNKDIEDNFLFVKSDMSKLLEKKIEVEKHNKVINKLMLENRDFLREMLFKFTMNYKVMQNAFMLPVNLYRLTQDYSNDKLKSKTDLRIDYVLKGIDDILNDYDYRLLTYNSNKNKLFMEDEKHFKKLFKIALEEYLSPKKCIIDMGLSKKEFENLCIDIKKAYIRSMIDPGEMIGIIAAQSIGEPTSQMTLNTKHSAGVVSSANMGVPRIQELLSNSKNLKAPQMIVYLKDEYKNNKNLSNKVASNFKHLTIRELIDSVEIYYHINSSDSLSNLLVNDKVSVPFFINNKKTDLNSLPIVFRLKINLEKMLDKDTNLLDIKTKFIGFWYENFNNLKQLKKSHKKIISDINKLAILGNNDNIIHIRFSMSTFNYNSITDFLKIVLDDITLKGMTGINDSNLIEERFIKFNQDGSSEVTKENVIITSGINFDMVNRLKAVDYTRTRCNDISTIVRNYGIEAGRSVLYNEFVTAFSSSRLNHNHLAVLVDLMTCLGKVISIDRFGLNKLDTDPMTKASFEKTMDHFLNAAIYNEVDKVNSVSSRIMVGRVINGGTGSFDLLLNTEKLENIEYSKDETGGRITFKPLEEDSILDDILKFGLNETDFFIPN